MQKTNRQTRSGGFDYDLAEKDPAEGENTTKKKEGGCDKIVDIEQSGRNVRNYLRMGRGGRWVTIDISPPT